MPIRNPFSRRPGINIVPADPVSDENAHPNAGTRTPPAFEKVDTMGSRTSGLSIDSRRSQDNGEYKMSVVNDSGVYLPPSPTEKTSFWGTKRSNPSSTSVARTSIGESEPFAISRESFDSYRRSFDISARSPVVYGDAPGRQSLDSARLRYPRASMDQRLEPAEEKFEDVGLNDDHHAALAAQQQPKPRKRGFFSKFGEGDQQQASPHAQPQTSSQQSGSRFHIIGRKRGQSGQGAELGNWKAPETTVTKEVEEIH